MKFWETHVAKYNRIDFICFVVDKPNAIQFCNMRSTLSEWERERERKKISQTIWNSMHKLALRVVRQEIKIDRSTRRSSVKTVLLVRASSVAAMFPFFLYVTFADARSWHVRGEWKNVCKAFAVTATRQRRRDRACLNVCTVSVCPLKRIDPTSARSNPIVKKHQLRYNFQFDCSCLTLNINAFQLLQLLLRPSSSKEK